MGNCYDVSTITGGRLTGYVSVTRASGPSCCSGFYVGGTCLTILIVAIIITCIVLLIICVGCSCRSKSAKSPPALVYSGARKGPQRHYKVFLAFVALLAAPAVTATECVVLLLNNRSQVRLLTMLVQIDNNGHSPINGRIEVVTNRRRIQSRVQVLTEAMIAGHDALHHDTRAHHERREFMIVEHQPIWLLLPHLWYVASLFPFGNSSR
jgi:hypothetical protein